MALHHSMRVMSSSKSIEWATPLEWFNYLDLEFGFTLDPCCTHENTKCEQHFTQEEDGLSQSWADQRVFVNPPYGRAIRKWMEKAYTEARDHGALVVCLVPARVDTNWWHDYAMRATEIRFPKGRIHFGDSPSPFPSAIVIFRSRL